MRNAAGRAVEGFLNADFRWVKYVVAVMMVVAVVEYEMR